MGDKEPIRNFFINGQEINGIGEGDLTINYEQDTVERDCEIKTTHGIIHFKAVFTMEQWAEFVKISEISRQKGTE